MDVQIQPREPQPFDVSLIFDNFDIDVLVKVLSHTMLSLFPPLFASGPFHS